MTEDFNKPTEWDHSLNINQIVNLKYKSNCEFKIAFILKEVKTVFHPGNCMTCTFCFLEFLFSFFLQAHGVLRKAHGEVCKSLTGRRH